MTEYKFEKINLQMEHMTLQERVYEILKNDILSGKIPPNTSYNLSESLSQ